MGLFKRNTPAPCHRHRSPIDSRDLDGTVSGSLAAFKFAISAGLKKQIRFFSERSPTPPDSFISKNEGMAKVALMFVSSLDAVPPDEARRRPVGRHCLHQEAPGIFGGEGDPLGLASF